MSTTTSNKTLLVFENVADMQAFTTIETGTICETLGYYRKGDGGAAKYTIETKGTSTPNGMDIIAIGTDLIAKFMHEGKPVNVLQFGAKNTYDYIEKDEEPERNESPAIQQAIEYTIDRLYQSFGTGYGDINYIVIPAGHYFIQDQINMPPHMQIRLDGDVQFLSFVKADHSQLYRYDPDYVDENNVKPYFVKFNSHDEIANETEVFAKNEFTVTKPDGTIAVLKKDFSGDEYYTYKKGIIKICNRFTEDGHYEEPYNGRFAVSPLARSEVFCGTGTLTILNKTYVYENPDSENEKRKIPCYICGIEVGNTSDCLRHHNSNSPISKHAGPNMIYVPYNNLQFSNLKIRNCYVGFLTHGYAFYSNVIHDSEFFDNVIGFQFGINGEKTWAHNNSSFGILGEEAIDSIEMNHFRDCLFTGNKISVNLLLSSALLNFTSCHFDFENCVIRAAYRTSINMDNCHIEGIGKELGDKYFPGGIPDFDSLLNFENRTNNDHMDEFIGILYAKPVTKINGTKVDQYSYVNLNIVNSMIVENMYMPWSVFSFYNDGKNASDVTDGHNRSNLRLENITYATTNGRPVSFLTTTDNGAVHSGFLLSEYPESDTGNAYQNVPAVSRDSKEWASWASKTSNKVNHRFLSNRTLALRDPYFKKITTNENGSEFSHVTVTLKNVSTDNLDMSYIDSNNILGSIVELLPKGYNNFSLYEPNSKVFRISNLTYVFSAANRDQLITTLTAQKPQVEISFDNDLIDCEKGDVLNAALVTDIIAFNEYWDIYGGSVETEALSHSIKFVEFDDKNIELGSYSYAVPYCVADDNATGYMDPIYPSTAICRHIISGKDTKKVKIVIGISIPITAMSDSSSYQTYTELHGVLVEKNK